jgi:hypothetical protein
MKQVTINGVYYAQVFGGTLPGPIWRDAMEAALVGTEPEDFDLSTSFGFSTLGPRDYVYVPPPVTPQRDEPEVFDNTPPEPAPVDPAPVDPAPPAEPAPPADPAPNQPADTPAG